MRLNVCLMHVCVFSLCVSVSGPQNVCVRVREWTCISSIHMSICVSDVEYTWPRYKNLSQGKNNDKNLLFQKMPEHKPDGYEGALQKTKQTLELNNTLSDSIHENAWNPNGTHTFSGKGTASILDNVVKSKHKVLRGKWRIEAYVWRGHRWDFLSFRET